MTGSEVVRRQIRDLVEIIDSAGTARVPVERHDHVVLAMAAISRCRSLLLGAVALDRAGRADIVGVPVRALIELWYFGVIALLGDDDDLRRLEEDYRYWKNDLAKQFPGVNRDEGAEAKFSVHQRAKRADELVVEIGQPAGVALEYYRVLYASESLTSTHAGFESLKTYVFEDEEGRLGIVRDPGDDNLTHGRLRIAVVLTLLLAKWTWDRAGLDSSRFDEVEG